MTFSYPASTSLLGDFLSLFPKGCCLDICSCYLQPHLVVIHFQDYVQYCREAGFLQFMFQQQFLLPNLVQSYQTIILKPRAEWGQWVKTKRTHAFFELETLPYFFWREPGLKEGSLLMVCTFTPWPGRHGLVTWLLVDVSWMNLCSSSSRLL